MSEARGAKLIDIISKHQTVLHALLAEAGTKPELQDRCDVSRSTLDRWITRVEGAGLVHRADDRFELTLFGQIAMLKFNRLEGQLRRLGELRDSLAMLSEETDIEPRVFERADVAVYDGLAPELTDELLAHGGQVRLLNPPLTWICAAFNSQTPSPEIDIEIVLEHDLIGQLQGCFSTHHSSSFSAANVDVYGVDETPHFGGAIVDQENRQVAYLIFVSAQSSVGAIACSTPDAVAWCETVFEEYRDRAEERQQLRSARPFDILRDSTYRAVLLGMLRGDVEHADDVVLRSEHADANGSPRNEQLLDELMTAEYIEWDSETGKISKGPRFEQIEPMLELIGTIRPGRNDAG